MNNLTKIIPLLYIAAAAVVGIVLWRTFREGGPAVRAITSVTDLVTEPLAGLIASRNAVEIVDESNNIALPNGQKITWTQVVAAGSKLSSDNTFVWQGVRYRVTGRGENNVWLTSGVT